MAASGVKRQLPVTVVTDSTVSLPATLLKEYGIRVIPLHVIVGGRDRRDGVDFTAPQIYEILEQGGKLPTTSAINPAEFARVFAELTAAARAVLYVSVTGALSATYDCACTAAEMVRGEQAEAQIEIIDSRTSCGAMGFVAMAAARSGRTGMGLERAAQDAKALVPRVKYVCVRETLRYLIRMGRAPAGATEQLDVRQVTGLNTATGRVELLAKLPADGDRALALADTVGRMVDPVRPLRAIVHYSNNREEGERLATLLKKRSNYAEMHLAEYSPLVTCSAGPLLGVGFYS